MYECLNTYISVTLLLDFIRYIWHDGPRGGAVSWGTASRKVVGSIPDGVDEIFH
jgi:hypothetical protein